jgi:hypothetical protein
LVTGIQHYSRSVGNRDTASRDRDTASVQLVTGIQHQVSCGHGYSIWSVGTGYTTNDTRSILVAIESLAVNASIVAVLGSITIPPTR